MQHSHFSPHRNLIAPGQQSVLYFRAKRAVDLVLALGLLALLLPIILLVVIIIKLDSPGSAIFIQERMGYDWHTRTLRSFRCYKFRSMVANCDQSPHQRHIRAWVRGDLDDSDLGLVKLVGDPRVTRAGHWLRKTSLDELPQLWNVLRGEMTMVGPRPVPLYEVEEYDPWHRQRLLATPGITGIWQVSGRGTTTLVEMVNMDLEYIAHQSLWLDLKLMLLTIPAVLRGRGAT
jgi:lipopolysaccharide/colanic/teichoic acid biosynthesis glycosyltransferase